MRNKICVFFIVLMIPFLILFVDKIVFNDVVHVDASYDQSDAWKYISENEDKYPTSLIQLALRNKETIPFVYHYPQKKNNNDSMTLTKELESQDMPLLLQWDERWGYKTYGNDMMAINGCGPTCLSMVASYLKQDEKLNPYYIAQYSYHHGYFKDGTSWDLMKTGARELGLQVEELSLSQELMIQNLENKNPIICSVRKGTFTTTGHFIVLREYKDGKFYVNDPNSRKKSQQGYTFETLAPQIKNLWAYDL